MGGGGGGGERSRIEVTQDPADELGGLAVDKLFFFMVATIAAPAAPRQDWHPAKNAPAAASDSSSGPSPSSFEPSLSSFVPAPTASTENRADPGPQVRVLAAGEVMAADGGGQSCAAIRAGNAGARRIPQRLAEEPRQGNEMLRFHVAGSIPLPPFHCQLFAPGPGKSRGGTCGRKRAAERRSVANGAEAQNRTPCRCRSSHRVLGFPSRRLPDAQFGRRRCWSTAQSGEDFGRGDFTRQRAASAAGVR